MLRPLEGRRKDDLTVINSLRNTDPGPPECPKLYKTVINVDVPRY